MPFSKCFSALVKHIRYAVVTYCPRDGGQAEPCTKAARAPVNSPERQFQPPEKAARGAGIDRARSGYRKHAARVLRSRHRIDAVGDVIGGGHIGPVEDILYFEEQHKPPEISVIDLTVVMHVEIDQTVGRRLQHIGVLHEEPVLPDILSEPSQPLQRSVGLVVTKSRRYLVRRNAGDLVVGAIEGAGERAGAQLLRLLAVELVIVAVGSNQLPARQRAPIERNFYAAMLGTRDVGCEVLQARPGRLRDELVAEELVEMGDAELERLARGPVHPVIDPDIGL